MKKELNKLVGILRRILGIVVAIPLFATLFVATILLVCFSVIALPFEWIITGDSNFFFAIMVFIEDNLWGYGIKTFNKIIGE